LSTERRITIYTRRFHPRKIIGQAVRNTEEQKRARGRRYFKPDITVCQFHNRTVRGCIFSNRESLY